jgi:hypothetical protein
MTYGICTGDVSGGEPNGRVPGLLGSYYLSQGRKVPVVEVI